MNALLTITVLTGFYMVGFAVEGSRFDRPIVGAVDAGSPAEKAGLVPGDEILVDRRQAAARRGRRRSTTSCCGPRRPSTLRVAARRERARRSPLRSEATTAEKIGSIGVHPLVRVGQVLPGQPAEAAGLQHGRRDPRDRRQAGALVRRDPADRRRRGRQAS